MDKAQLEAIREKISGEPEDSPAKLLLAYVDSIKASERRRLIDSMMCSSFYTEEEATKILEYEEAGNKIDFNDMEEVNCRFCCGTGHGTRDGCFGSVPSIFAKCEHCYYGKKTRFKVPT